MFENEREIYFPTDEEEAEIQRQIAEDPDAPEWTEEDWARARPAIEVDPELVEWSLRRRGKQKAPTKELISIRLDPDITASFPGRRPGLADPAERHLAPGSVRSLTLPFREGATAPIPTAGAGQAPTFPHQGGRDFRENEKATAL